MIQLIEQLTKGKRVCILGYGIEGRSTYQLLRQHFPELQICIADRDENLKNIPDVQADNNLVTALGSSYIETAATYDFILKTPGIPLKDLQGIPEEKISTQTEIFIQSYRNKIIGISGTKGKSTTSSLVYHILRECGYSSLLVGNIGTPPFQLAAEVDETDYIVYELSSHQLENIRYSPAYAILLNLYEEHLDHYRNAEEYYHAKLNLARYQEQGDVYIYHDDGGRLQESSEEIAIHSRKFRYDYAERNGIAIFLRGSEIIFKQENETAPIASVEENPLRGKHNQLNIMAASGICHLLGCSLQQISAALKSFTPLPHRLEYIGCIEGIHYYNDSISTIPEAAQAAIEALDDVDTIILGGYDRGIDYREFALYLYLSPIRNFLFMGEAGWRIMQLTEGRNPGAKHLEYVSGLEEAVAIAKKRTAPGKACLLSPAAASYDQFKNFAERGNAFKKYVIS